MTPIIGSLYTCVCRKPRRTARQNVSGKLTCFLLGMFVSVPALAVEGTDVSADEFYSDHVTVTTFDGNPLDINGDGLVDLAVGINSGANDAFSRVYLGNGDGTFQATAVALDNRATSEIVAADLNGDMFIDLVQGVRDLRSRFFPGNGAGGLGSPSDILDSDRVLAVALGDLDGDGDLDLVTGTGHAGGEPGTGDTLQENRVYVNTGAPSAGAAPVFVGSDISADRDDTRSIALADMDGDGKLDVLAGNDETTAGSNRIYLNQSSGADTVTFAAGFDFGPADDQTSKVLVGDLNGDGLDDIVTLNYIAPGSPGLNRYFLNESAPGVLQFTQADVSTDAHLSSGGALADFDGDGDLDIAVANLVNGGAGSARNRLYLNQFIETGDVSFIGSDISADEHQTRELAAGDIDDDGDIDIIAANQPLEAATDGVDVPGQDRVYLNNGTEAPFTDPVAPSFTSTPVTDATVGAAYTYEITVTDPQSDPVTITAPTLPAWLTLTDNTDGTATLSGTPASGDVGDHPVSLEASDGTNAAPQDFTITVAEATGGENNAPTFTSTAVTSATEGEAYTYDITASDDDGDALTITAPTLPAWLTFTDNGDGTATLSGTPGADHVGDHEASLEVSDGTDVAVQEFVVTVEEASSAPPPPPPGNGGDSGGGGGGSIGAGFLLVLAGFGAVLLRRRSA